MGNVTQVLSCNFSLCRVLRVLFLLSMVVLDLFFMTAVSLLLVFTRVVVTLVVCFIYLSKHSMDNLLSKLIVIFLDFFSFIIQLFLSLLIGSTYKGWHRRFFKLNLFKYFEIIFRQLCLFFGLLLVFLPLLLLFLCLLRGTSLFSLLFLTCVLLECFCFLLVFLVFIWQVVASYQMSAFLNYLLLFLHGVWVD